MLEKSYRPSEVEERQYSRWEKLGVFNAGGIRQSATPYTIVVPPPNVTGSLHMGHALNFTLQDIIVRRERMRGRDVLWQPGTDHAGIATQMVVERELEEAGSSRKAIGRSEFVKKVWAWKDLSGGTIVRQLRRLGCSCDWSRERFTMDEGLSRAVTKVFVNLYKKGLIYKDKRLVNWDPKLQTAISDLEVQQKEVDGHIWYLRYPLENAPGKQIVVATTRPETMLGDTAVAVHPEDNRYRGFIGKFIMLPLVQRRIPVIADEYADMSQGTGAVKITPAHDFNDFEVARRHNLEMINIFDVNAQLNQSVPEKYRGLDRFIARKRILADLDALGFLDHVEAHSHVIPYSDRGGVPIEPYLTDQWYADAATLAAPAIAAVETGRTNFVPEYWTKTYFDWMKNIQPWCISRQLWWGHQIPAWYGPDGTLFVEEDEATAIEVAKEFYNNTFSLTRDEDVLDTWFSSALWPFSTLGWPDDASYLSRYFPTDLLVTGFDIIFFWVSRMMMMSLHFMEEVPFKTVYIHALIRDSQGQKMSKSKGNVMDPLELIDEYGCDALRFTLASLASPGRDIKLSPERVANGRNFATKIWNVARFCQLNECVMPPEFNPRGVKIIVNRWIIGELVNCSDQVSKALNGYNFNEAASILYQFCWGTFCDWYIELIKPLIGSENTSVKVETRIVIAFILDQMLRLLHPFMPYISEEIWNEIYKDDSQRLKPLIIADWPQHSLELIDNNAKKEMDWVVQLIQGVRSIRSELHVPVSATVPFFLLSASFEIKKRLSAHKELITRLARVEHKEYMSETEIAIGSVQLVQGDSVVVLQLGEIIDIEHEKLRLESKLASVKDEISKLKQKLSNKGFVTKAPAHVVEDQRKYLKDAQAQITKLEESLDRLAT